MLICQRRSLSSVIITDGSPAGRDVVALLMAHEASVNLADVSGSTPLHLAAWTGNVEVVRTLITHGPGVTNVDCVVSTRLPGVVWWQWWRCGDDRSRLVSDRGVAVLLGRSLSGFEHKADL